MKGLPYRPPHRPKNYIHKRFPHAAWGADPDAVKVRLEREEKEELAKSKQSTKSKLQTK